MRNSSSPARHRALTSVFQLHFQSQTTTKCDSDSSTVTKAPSFSSVKGWYRAKKIISFNVSHQGSSRRKYKLLLNLLTLGRDSRTVLNAGLKIQEWLLGSKSLMLLSWGIYYDECRGASSLEIYCHKVPVLVRKGTKEDRKNEPKMWVHFKDQNLSIMRSICPSI